VRANYQVFAVIFPSWYRESMYILDMKISKDPRERLAEGEGCRYWPRERNTPHIAHRGKLACLNHPVFGQDKDPLKV
jgi:hypothetical protein